MQTVLQKHEIIEVVGRASKPALHTVGAKEMPKSAQDHNYMCVGTE